VPEVTALTNFKTVRVNLICSASSPSSSDREPYEICSSSSGISSASPEPRASISCSDSLVTSDSVCQ
jgi:hypothetical protein